MESRSQGVDLSIDYDDLSPNEADGKRWKERLRSSFSPFERVDPNPGIYEIAKSIFNACWLLPLRVICILITLSVYYIVARLYLMCRPSKKFCRDALKTFTRGCARLLLLFCGFHYIQVYGDAHVDANIHMIVSNHISFWEILYFISSPSCPTFVFKATCLNVPLIGKIALEVLQGIKVDNKVQKGGGTQAIIDRVAMMKEAESNSFRPIVIFSEGTTSNGSCMMRFRSGGFVPAVPVQPVLVNFPFKNFSLAYESIYTSVVLFRTLTQFHNQLQVRYLSPYYPSPEEKEDPALYADNVRQVMARKMNVPLCDVGYDDKRKFHRVLARKFNQHTLGWVSNCCIVKPDTILDGELTPLEYIYYPSRDTAKVEDCVCKDEEKEDGHQCHIEIE